ncbi:MAG: hypothetical protein WCK77_25990, partial [Verrucomicrobiota bacterium]
GAALRHLAATDLGAAAVRGGQKHVSSLVGEGFMSLVVAACHARSQAAMGKRGNHECNAAHAGLELRCASAVAREIRFE